MLKDYEYIDDVTSEYFFVECETREEADRIAKCNFAEPRLIDIVTPEIAEIEGLDTY